MVISNEELVELIKNGDNGALPLLWEQVRRFIKQRAMIYYNRFGDNKHGIEVDDLIQQGYFAVLEAVKYYSPEKGYAFTTYLTKTLKKAFRTAAGIRTKKRDMLDYALSLDEPVGGEDEDITLLDLVADITPGNTPDDYIENVYNQELRHALDKALEVVSEKQREIVYLHYYFGLSLRQIAEATNTSFENVSEKEYNAFLRIRRSRQGRILRHFLFWWINKDWYDWFSEDFIKRNR